MKTPAFSSLLTVCSLALCHGSVSAQDNTDRPPPSPEAVQPRDGDNGRPRPPRAEGEQSRQGHPGDRERGSSDRRGPEPEMRATPYIGVFTRPLSDDVRAHTGLAPDFGLIVEEIMPDSPAKAAGLQQHDVLVMLGDQRLVNQEQLSALVRAEKKDADIAFTIKRGGAEQKVTVKVGEKMMPVAFNRRSPGGDEGQFGGMFNRMFGNKENLERFGHEMREQAEKFRDGMNQFQDRMQDWSRSGPQNRDTQRLDNERGPSPQNRRPQGRPPGDSDTGSKPGEFHSRTSSSGNFQRNVVRRDDSGEYSLSDNNGAKIFTVKPTSGDEQTFIVNTEEQRTAVPENLRAKLKELENVDDRVKTDTPKPAPAETPKPGI